MGYQKNEIPLNIEKGGLERVREIYTDRKGVVSYNFVTGSVKTSPEACSGNLEFYIPSKLSFSPHRTPNPRNNEQQYTRSKTIEIDGIPVLSSQTAVQLVTKRMSVFCITNGLMWPHHAGLSINDSDSD
jgi:hypothetical protein